MVAEVPREGESIFGRRGKPDYIIDATTGCWNWTKATNARGYPASGTRKVWHLYWEAANGRTLPEGWHVHHLCMNTGCLNPDHLQGLSPDEHFIHHHLTEKGLTLEHVREARELGRDPECDSEVIAKRYGVTGRTVRNWWSGYTWARLLGEEGPVLREGGICELTDCDNQIVGRNKGARFCSPRCRITANHRRRNARKAAARRAQRAAFQDKHEPQEGS